MPEYLKAAEVARRWRVSPRTVQRYIASGRLKADRLPGGQYRIRAEDAEAALATDTTTRCWQALAAQHRRKIARRLLADPMK